MTSAQAAARRLNLKERKFMHSEDIVMTDP
jgi:hypothetical protein